MEMAHWRFYWYRLYLTVIFLLHSTSNKIFADYNMEDPLFLHGDFVLCWQLSRNCIVNVDFNNIQNI